SRAGSQPDGRNASRLHARARRARRAPLPPARAPPARAPASSRAPRQGRPARPGVERALRGGAFLRRLVAVFDRLRLRRLEPRKPVADLRLTALGRGMALARLVE